MRFLDRDELELVAVRHRDQRPLGQAQQLLDRRPADTGAIQIPSGREHIEELGSGLAEVIGAGAGIHGGLQVTDPEAIPEEAQRIEPGLAAGAGERVDPGERQLVAGAVLGGVGIPGAEGRVAEHCGGQGIAKGQILGGHVLRGAGAWVLFLKALPPRLPQLRVFPYGISLGLRVHRAIAAGLGGFQLLGGGTLGGVLRQHQVALAEQLGLQQAAVAEIADQELARVLLLLAVGVDELRPRMGRGLAEHHLQQAGVPAGQLVVGLAGEASEGLWAVGEVVAPAGTPQGLRAGISRGGGGLDRGEEGGGHWRHSDGLRSAAVRASAPSSSSGSGCSRSSSQKSSSSRSQGVIGGDGAGTERRFPAGR